VLNDGDRAGAAREVQAVWHTAELSAELESAVATTFHDQLAAADDTVRMDHRIGAKDFPTAMRAAKRLGSAQVAIVKACEETEANSSKAGPSSQRYQRTHKPIWATPCAGCAGYWPMTILPRRSSSWPKFQAMICSVKTPMNGGENVAC